MILPVLVPHSSDTKSNEVNVIDIELVKQTDLLNKIFGQITKLLEDNGYFNRDDISINMFTNEHEAITNGVYIMCKIVIKPEKRLVVKRRD